MALEIEAKMKVSDLAFVRARLHDAEAEPLGRTFETNVFFDTEDHALLSNDEGLRLRTNHDAESGDETHIITFKGPLQPGRVKAREEVELTVGSARDAIHLLEKLRLLKTLSFQKRRETWKLQGCKVELDEVPHLGCFVEVEGPDEQTVLHVRTELGLDNEPIVKTSYIAMLMAYLGERAKQMREVNFEDA